MFIAGCSIDDQVLLAKVTWLENASGTGTAMAVESFGFHVSTFPIDRGLTVGVTRRVYFFPGEASSLQRDWRDFVAADHRLRPTDERPPPGAAPVAVLAASAALEVQAGSLGGAIRLGLGKQATLLLPSDGSTAVIIRCNDRGDSPSFALSEILP